MRYLDFNDRKLHKSVYQFLRRNQELIKNNRIDELFNKARQEGFASGRSLVYAFAKIGYNILSHPSLNYIPARACYYDLSLSEIDIPDNIEVIKESAFSGCSAVKKLTIPSNVDTIEDWAFSDMDNLTEVTIKGELMAMGGHVFEDCPNLEVIRSLRTNKDLLYETVDVLQQGLCAFKVI